MPDDNMMCFGTNPKLPLLLRVGPSRQWMSNLCNKKLNYKLSFENPNSCFSINSSQTTGEIPEQGQLLIDFTRKKDDKRWKAINRNVDMIQFIFTTQHIMPEDGLIFFGSNPRLPLLVKAGVSRHWMTNLCNKKLTYKLSFENPNSCFSITPSQTTGEIGEQGQLLIDFTRRPGQGKEDKLTIEYTGPPSGKTIVRVMPVE
ncbi:hypothetical protein GCK32_007207 [Trichostrongylus colubriformis]|uniref:MSP domain-containing protein n=1 Tax=Trichostrongylus colubriformis TaxID=6319 RepID=A0AAN8FFT2_TRICO